MGGFEYTQSKEMRRIAKRVDASLMEKKESGVFVSTEQGVNIYVEGGMCVCNSMQRSGKMLGCVFAIGTFNSPAI